ncbi:hypothetical protein PO124_11805 [Bacillus licheniformis]|nr:hypothetical protein [Bacillus licheniformis]
MLLFKANNYAHLGLFKRPIKRRRLIKGRSGRRVQRGNAELLDLLDMGEEDQGYSQFDQDDLILKQDRAKSLLEMDSFRNRSRCLKKLFPITLSLVGL